MACFADLMFKGHRNHPDGTQATTFWPNGRGVSVIKSRYSYGGDAGLYELAVLRGTAAAYDLDYTTPITSDVEGHLTHDDVTRLMGEVAALPLVEGAA